MRKNEIVVVEDEALIADHIEQTLIEAGYNVVGVFDNADDTFHFFNSKSADLILLDINLNGSLDGVDIAHQINKNYQIPIVFLTSNTDKNTVDRVKHTIPSGFVTKPFTAEDLISNIEIAMYKSSINMSSSSKSFDDSSFFVKDKGALVKVVFSDIFYVEAMDNYAAIYLKDKRFVLPHTLKTVFELLEPYGFIKTHRSFVVNTKKIESILPKSIVVGNKEIPLSENHRTEVLSKCIFL
jgi:DNA-binding LytR/AlgR family response regulator